MTLEELEKRAREANSAANLKLLEARAADPAAAGPLFEEAAQLRAEAEAARAAAVELMPPAPVDLRFEQDPRLSAN
jgi:hypothetical protein